MGLSKEIKALRDRIVEYRRHFHMYPEVSNKEYETADFIVSEP
jgi:metal-dependent amidase/aminoacylase/carboxypeptidase family protein